MQNKQTWQTEILNIRDYADYLINTVNSHKNISKHITAEDYSLVVQLQIKDINLDITS